MLASTPRSAASVAECWIHPYLPLMGAVGVDFEEIQMTPCREAVTTQFLDTFYSPQLNAVAGVAYRHSEYVRKFAMFRVVYTVNGMPMQAIIPEYDSIAEHEARRSDLVRRASLLTQGLQENDDEQHQRD